MTDVSSAVLAQLAEQASAIAALQDHLADLQSKAGVGEEKTARTYVPRPIPQWHRLAERERDAEIGRLRGFLREFGPLYGHLVKFGQCWQQHPLAVIAIEITCELHLLLFTGERRPPSVLSGQAEFLIRVALDCSSSPSVRRAHVTGTGPLSPSPCPPTTALEARHDRERATSY